MANNRMFLVYVPTGDAVFLGKTMLDGWYQSDDTLAARLARLFEIADEDSSTSSAFALAMEVSADTRVLTSWDYGARSADGLTLKLVLKP